MKKKMLVIILAIIAAGVCILSSVDLLLGYNTYMIDMGNSVNYDNYENKEYDRYRVNDIVVCPDVNTVSENEFSIIVRGYSKKPKEVTVTKIQMFELDSGDCLFENNEHKTLHTHMVDDDRKNCFDFQEYEVFSLNSKYLIDGNEFAISIIAETGNNPSDYIQDSLKMEYKYRGIKTRVFDTI